MTSDRFNARIASRRATTHSAWLGSRLCRIGAANRAIPKRMQGGRTEANRARYEELLVRAGSANTSPRFKGGNLHEQGEIVSLRPIWGCGESVNARRGRPA